MELPIVTTSVVQFGSMMVLVGAVDRETGAISPEVISWAAKLSVAAVSVRREEQAQKATLDLCFGYSCRMFKFSFAAIRSDDIETGASARFIAKTGFAISRVSYLMSSLVTVYFRRKERGRERTCRSIAIPALQRRWECEGEGCAGCGFKCVL